MNPIKANLKRLYQYVARKTTEKHRAAGTSHKEEITIALSGIYRVLRRGGVVVWVVVWSGILKETVLNIVPESEKIPMVERST